MQMLQHSARLLVGSSQGSGGMWQGQCPQEPGIMGATPGEGQTQPRGLGKHKREPGLHTWWASDSPKGRF